MRHTSAADIEKQRTVVCDDDVEQFYEQLPPLRFTELRSLQALDIQLDALRGPEAPAKRHRVVFHTGRPFFDFAGERRVEGDGLPAIIFLARDELGQPADLVAWEPAKGRLAAWLGRVALLGADQLWAPRIAYDGALVVFESPLEWLRGDRRGVVVIDAKRAAPQLRFAGKLCAASVDAGLRLDATLKADQPKIVVPKRILEIAA